MSGWWAGAEPSLAFDLALCSLLPQGQPVSLIALCQPVGYYSPLIAALVNPLKVCVWGHWVSEYFFSSHSLRPGPGS